MAICLMAYPLALRDGRIDDGGDVCWRVFLGVTLSLRLLLLLAMAMVRKIRTTGKGREDVIAQ